MAMIELGKGGGAGASAGGAAGVIDTSDAGFMSDVIEASAAKPIVVLFWSPADPASVQLGKEIERQVAATNGAVGLARLDIDKNVMVAEQLRLQAVPAAIAFYQRQGLDGFQGMAAPQQIQEFMARVMAAAGASPGEGPGSLEEALDMADQMLAAEQAEDALQTYAAIAAEDAKNARALAGIARALLALGKPAEARQTLEGAPEEIAGDPLIAAALSAVELAEASAEAGEVGELRARLDANPADHEARFDLATALLAKNDNEGAIEALLELFRRDRDWNEGAAKERLLKLFESLGPTDPLVAKGRRRLSSMMFA